MLRATLPRSPVSTGLLLTLCLWPVGGRANREPAPAGTGLSGPAAAAGAPATPLTDTRIKIVPKPVPCVPCPCECPEVKGPQVASLPPQTSQQGTVTNPATLPQESRPPEPERPEAVTVRPLPPRPAPPPPPRGVIAGSAIVRDRGGHERSDNSDVVVYIEKMPRRYAALKRERKMAQRDKTFTPHVLAVTRGSSVEFPNEDKFFHNVFSLSEGNTFDLGLYRAGTSKNVTFEKTGVVDVYCNIHPNMWAQVIVLDNPFYSVTSKEGTFEIPKVPPGNYTLVAWLSGGDSVRQPVHVPPGGRAQVRFDLKEGASAKPHLNKFNQPYGRYK